MFIIVHRFSLSEATILIFLIIVTDYFVIKRQNFNFLLFVVLPYMPHFLGKLQVCTYDEEWGGGRQSVLPPCAAESKGLQIGQQNDYFK